MGRYGLGIAARDRAALGPAELTRLREEPAAASGLPARPGGRP